MDETKSGSIVRAVVSFMFQLVVGLLLALEGKFAVRAASVKPKNSVAEDSGVVRTVVILPLECGAPMSNETPICNGCKSTRVAGGHKPRELTRLPVEVTQDSVFNNRGLPIWLCEFCDEHELKAALAAHQKRIDNK